jgi:hypothetical protein
VAELLYSRPENSADFSETRYVIAIAYRYFGLVKPIWEMRLHRMLWFWKSNPQKRRIERETEE